MKEFFAAFTAQVRAAIAKLPTAESLEANGEVSWALRQLAEVGVRLEVQFPALKGVTESAAVEAETGKLFDAFLATVKAEAGAAAIANAEKDGGTHIPKAAHELAVQTAAANAEAAAKTKFEKATADNAEAEGRRAKLVEAGLRAEAAAKIPATALVGDNAEANVTKVTERIAKLKGVGLSVADHAESFDLCATALDEAGDVAFAGALSLAEKTAAAAKATAANAEDLTKSKPKGNPAETQAAGTGEKKPMRLC
jgi:hypothetical protein